MILKIYIEDQIIDLFKDETIELNSSVANAEDISKVNTDYTKTFTVPASDRNNYIFKHYYNADIDNTFDARTKKNARIELDGFPFRSGKMRLEKVAVKSGVASSYTINFWGTLVNFKTLIKDDMLSSLDLTAYDHAYTFENVRSGLTTDLWSKAIIYTLMNQRRQYMYSSDPSNNTNTDKLVNIAYNGNDRGVAWNELKPSIRLINVIEAIEAKYGFTFSRDFFGRTEFKELYMWLNNPEDAGYTEQEINWTSFDFASGQDFDPGLNLATNEWIINNYTYVLKNINYIIYVTPEPGYENVAYRVLSRNNNFINMQQEATGTYESALTPSPDPAFNTKFYISASATFKYTAKIMFRATTIYGYGYKRAASMVGTIVDNFDVSKAVPKMKTIDFIKGLLNMFKLVVIPDSIGNVYVNNINDYYREGTLYDVTKWVDWDSYDVERGKIFNTINFKFQEPTTILNMEYKKIYGVAYGDNLLSLSDAEGEPLDGDTMEMTMPFEQVLFERLTNLYNNRLTDIQYGLITNETLEPANPKAVIFYNNPQSIAASPVSLMDGSGHTHQLNNLINTPASSLGLDNPSFSILWNREISTWNYVFIENNLFTNYWAAYIASIFNIKKRNFKFKANLPTWLMTKLNLNDVLFIKDRYYRVNDFTVDLTTGNASLNLTNTFENNFGLFAPGEKNVTLTNTEQSYGIYVSNGSVMNIATEDAGYGTAWATATQSGSNIIISVDENGTGEPRVMYINVNNGSGKSFQLYLMQNE